MSTGTKKPRRTRKKKKEEVTKDEHGQLWLSEELLNEYSRFMIQLDLAKANYGKEKLSLELWMERSHEYKKLSERLQQASTQLAAAGAAYNDFTIRTGEKAGYDLKRCSIDPETGKISIIDEKGKERPATPELIDDVKEKIKEMRNGG